MDYDNWNICLAKHFFNTQMKDRQVFLYVTPQLLQDLLQEACPGSSITTDEAVSDFCTAVASKARRNICETACNWSRDDNWLAGKVEFPPYIGFLSIFVLPLTSTAETIKRGYYNRLNHRLHQNSYVGTEVTTGEFSETRGIWEDLEIWSTSKKNSALGYYKFRRVGGWEHVGMPAAQALVKTEDSEKIEHLFQRYTLHDELLQGRLETDLRQSPGKYLTTSTTALLAGDDNGVKTAVIDLLLQLWQDYKTRPARVRIPPKRRTTVKISNAEQGPEVTVSTLVAIFQDYNTGNDLLCLAIQREGTEEAPDEMEIKFDGCFWTAERFRLEGNSSLYGPLIAMSPESEKSNYLFFNKPDQDFTIISQNGTFLMAEQEPEGPVFFLEAESESSTVEWLQIDPSRVELGSFYKVITRSAAEGTPACAFLKANGIEASLPQQIACNNLPAGWQLFGVTLKSLDHLLLPPRNTIPSRELRLMGGIRATQGNTRRYIYFAPPVIERVSICGVAAHLSDGLRVDLNRPKEQNRFALPSELHRPGEIRLIATKFDGHDDASIQTIQIGLIEPTMPIECTKVPVSRFPANLHGQRSGAMLFQVPPAPVFFFSTDLMVMEFEGGEKLPGNSRSYKPGKLPCVRFSGEPVDIASIHLACDEHELAFNASGTVDLSALDLQPGRHSLKLLWHNTAIGKQESFQIRETPDFQFSFTGTTKLDVQANGVSEYLIQSKPVVLEVEPTEDLSLKINNQWCNSQRVDLSEILNHEEVIRLQLYWKGALVEEQRFRFQKDFPKVEIRFMLESANRTVIFPRHGVPALTVSVQPETEIANLKMFCAGRECENSQGRNSLALPSALPSSAALTIRCKWRGVEIPCKTPRFQIIDAPGVSIEPNGGKATQSGTYFQGRLPSITMTGLTDGVIAAINGTTANLDEDGIVKALDNLVVLGRNLVQAIWFEKEVAQFSFDVIPAPALQLELIGGVEIVHGEYLMLNSNTTTPQIVGAPAGSDVSCNGNPLAGGCLTVDTCEHGINVLACSAFPGVKRFIVWKKYSLIGREQGQLTEPNAPTPQWPPIWVIAKFGQDHIAALFPSASVEAEPAQSKEIPKKQRRDWNDKIRDAELISKGVLPEVRALWKIYREGAKKWK